MHAAKSDLDFYTCMKEVDDPAQADAIVDIEYGTVQPVHTPPLPPSDGFVSCWSNNGAGSCTDGQFTTSTACSGGPGDVRCSSYTYDSGALLEGVLLARAEIHHAIMQKITSKAYLLDMNGKSLLWEYDEGVRHEKNGVSPFCWAQLNNFVGCGKTRYKYKRHMDQ